jgi:hypothetical protein
MHQNFVILRNILLLGFFFVSTVSKSNPDIQNVDNQANLYRLQTPLDFRLSPYTGFTRAHWLEITGKIIAGVMPLFDKVTGLPQFPPIEGAFAQYQKNYQEVNIPALRALERTLIAVAYYTKATGQDFVPGYKGSISEPYRKAIIRGTDPNDKQYWGDPQPGDQVGSVFAIAVYVNPELFWKPLTDKQKHNFLEWLRKQSYNKGSNNNFYYFHLAVLELLDRHGVESNRPFLTKMFERLMGWYQGDGWFLDGVNRGIDYYNMEAFHMYNQILYRFDSQLKDQFGMKIKNAASAFFQTYPWLFGHDGAPVPFGRSLTYRFACTAPVGWAVLNGLCPLPAGQSRRIVSGVLRYFWEHRCLDSNGLLSIGYWNTNTSMAESYIAAFDPYWAMQGMSCLLIPDTDPFWTAKEEPVPADGNGGKLAIKGAQFAIRINPVDGDVRLFPAGQPFYKKAYMGQVGSKYDQHAYSSTIGFCTAGEGSDDLGAGRSGYSFDGKIWFYRDRVRALQVDSDHLVSKYSMKQGDDDATPDYQLDEITTHTLIGNDGEIHVIWHSYPDPVFLYMGGYGISTSGQVQIVPDLITNGNLIGNSNFYSMIQVLNSVEGQIKTETLIPREGWSASHLFGGTGAWPYWKSTKAILPGKPVVFFVNATRGRKPFIPEVNVLTKPDKLSIRFEGKWYDISIPAMSVYNNQQ